MKFPNINVTQFEKPKWKLKDKSYVSIIIIFRCKNGVGISQWTISRVTVCLHNYMQRKKIGKLQQFLCAGFQVVVIYV